MLAPPVALSPPAPVTSPPVAEASTPGGGSVVEGSNGRYSFDEEGGEGSGTHGVALGALDDINAHPPSPPVVLLPELIRLIAYCCPVATALRVRTASHLFASAVTSNDLANLFALRFLVSIDAVKEYWHWPFVRAIYILARDVEGNWLYNRPLPVSVAVTSVRMLVTAGGYDPREGNSAALRIAADRGLFPLVSELLRLGSDPRASQEERRLDALMAHCAPFTCEDSRRRSLARAEKDAEYDTVYLLGEQYRITDFQVTALVTSQEETFTDYIAMYINESAAFPEIAYGHVDIVKEIFAQGVDVADHLDHAFRKAVEDGAVEVAKFLIAEAGVDVNMVDGDGRFPLVLAARTGKVDLVRAVLEAAADVHQGSDAALLGATLMGHAEVTRLLIAHGANVNACRPQGDLVNGMFDFYGTNYAVAGTLWNDDPSCFHILLDAGADIRSGDDAALRVAVYRGNVELTNLCLNRGADVHARNDAALMAAVYRPHYEIVRLLLERGANPNAQDGLALIHAVTEYQADVVRLLLLHGANVHCQNNICFRKVRPSQQLSEDHFLWKLFEAATDRHAAMLVMINNLVEHGWYSDLKPLVDLAKVKGIDVSPTFAPEHVLKILQFGGTLTVPPDHFIRCLLEAGVDIAGHLIRAIPSTPPAIHPDRNYAWRALRHLNQCSKSTALLPTILADTSVQAWMLQRPRREQEKYAIPLAAAAGSVDFLAALFENVEEVGPCLDKALIAAARMRRSENVRFLADMGRQHNRF